MSKAEEFAYSKYPKSKKGVLYDLARNSIIQGYRQAEQDLELTWEDIESIHRLMAHQEVAPILWKCGNEAFYQEVLKRFKELKNERINYTTKTPD